MKKLHSSSIITLTCLLYILEAANAALLPQKQPFIAHIDNNDYSLAPDFGRYFWALFFNSLPLNPSCKSAASNPHCLREAGVFACQDLTMEAKNLQPSTTSDNFNLYLAKRKYGDHEKINPDLISINESPWKVTIDGLVGAVLPAEKNYYKFDAPSSNSNSNNAASDDLIQIRIKIMNW